jgi:uncharacterized membrane protein YkvI
MLLYMNMMRKIQFGATRIIKTNTIITKVLIAVLVFIASNLELTEQAHSTRFGFAWSNLDEKEK